MTDPGDRAARLYLDLLKRTLVNLIYEDPPIPTPWLPGAVFDRAARLAGTDWPSGAHTMIGMARLDSLQALVETILAEDVPGDLLEAGVARGGAAVFLRGVLKAYGRADRAVWAADSFRGFPGPGDDPAGESELARRIGEATGGVAGQEAYSRFLRGTSLAEVERTFERYGLLDGQVRFVPGWFGQSLPAAPVGPLALLRVDADLYGSTLDVLRALYPRVSAGGFVVIDDFQVIDECRKAVEDYLAEAGESPRIERVDHSAVLWRRT